jgi:hypothetical protein
LTAIGWNIRMNSSTLLEHRIAPDSPANRDRIAAWLCAVGGAWFYAG